MSVARQQIGWHQQSGFTLVEAIMVLTITAILGAAVAVFLQKPVEAYFDLNRRAALSDAADTAARRVSRDLHLALPNSVRAVAGDSSCIEFLPTSTGGRYREQGDSSGAGNIFSTATSITALDFLGPLGLGTASSTPAPGDLLVINNLGIAGADAYAADNTAVIASVVGNTVNLNPAKQFLLGSPNRRFQVIPSVEQAVFYVCTGVGIDAAGNGTGILWRMNRYGINPTAPGICPVIPANTPILVQNLSACQFTCTPEVTVRSGLVSMRFGLTRHNETVNLFQDVHVNNAP
jgi:MSHA biogenesis protein MshO